jgi:hypothetical protein
MPELAAPVAAAPDPELPPDAPPSGATKSTDNGATWAAFIRLFDETNQRSYTRVCRRAANGQPVGCDL